MTEIEMMRTFQISLDGIRIETWPKGSTHRVSDDVLRILIAEGACAIVERKAYNAAPENKAAPRKRGRPRKARQ
jgi:hypothetical protein